MNYALAFCVVCSPTDLRRGFLVSVSDSSLFLFHYTPSTGECQETPKKERNTKTHTHTHTGEIKTLNTCPYSVLYLIIEFLQKLWVYLTL